VLFLGVSSASVWEFPGTKMLLPEAARSVLRFPCSSKSLLCSRYLSGFCCEGIDCANLQEVDKNSLAAAMAFEQRWTFFILSSC
jgi:hypothetical protein